MVRSSSAVSYTHLDVYKRQALKLPAEGGDLAVGFSTKQERDRAAALLLQTRGGVSKLVRLLAQKDTAVESLEPLRPVYVLSLIHICCSYSVITHES